MGSIFYQAIALPPSYYYSHLISLKFSATSPMRRVVTTARLYPLLYFSFYKGLARILSGLRGAYTYVLPNLFNFSNFYIKGFLFLLFIDACLTDDEPLWEPIEWSLVQTWILFIFIFAWIAENLIVSRYGSYTGRDKRVWLAWYKSFWMIEGFYVLNYGAVCLCVIVPYYYETNYNLSFVYSWWHWYSRVFFL